MEDGHFEASKEQMLNVKELEASARYFYNVEQISQAEKYADYFFKTVEYVFETHNRDYAEKFFTYLAPTFLRREQDKARYEALILKHVQSENTNFINLINNEIDLISQINL